MKLNVHKILIISSFKTRRRKKKKIGVYYAGIEKVKVVRNKQEAPAKRLDSLVGSLSTKQPDGGWQVRSCGQNLFFVFFFIQSPPHFFLPSCFFSPSGFLSNLPNLIDNVFSISEGLRIWVGKKKSNFIEAGVAAAFLLFHSTRGERE